MSKIKSILLLATLILFLLNIRSIPDERSGGYNHEATRRLYNLLLLHIVGSIKHVRQNIFVSLDCSIKDS